MILLFSFVLLSAVANAADEGKPAPEFRAKLLTGREFSLSKHVGQVVLIHFWATWCVPCRAEMPILNEYIKRHQTEGLKLVAVSMDKEADSDQVREAAKKFSFEIALSKNAIFKEYGRIWRLPLTFIIDRAGTLVKDGWKLDHSLTEADLDQVLSPLLQQVQSDSKIQKGQTFRHYPSQSHY